MSNKKIYFRLNLKCGHKLGNYFSNVLREMSDVKNHWKMTWKQDLLNAANYIDSQERYVVLGKIFQADLDRCAKWMRESFDDTWTCGDNSCSGHKYCKAYKSEFEEGGD
ncbi:MAG: hypothetical protein K0Q77_63 [Anaerosporomusa subterranea]|jgi:hypothetical protein|nr:hypothetical protein [Anaerosporomusa subterranea]